jgi:hypothetical protein
MRPRHSGILTALLVVLTSLAQGQEPRPGNVSEKIGVEDVPATLRQVAEEVAPRTDWRAAFKHTKAAGPTRLWYRLIGVQEKRIVTQEVRGNGDVDEVEKVAKRAVQVRVLPDGDVFDVWSQCTQKETPPKVLLKLVSEEPEAVVEMISAVSQGRKKDVIDYRFSVTIAGKEGIQIIVSADGEEIKREN